MNTWNKWWSNYAGHPDLKLLSTSHLAVDKFYFRPNGSKYDNQAVGRDPLGAMLKTMCESAGISPKTNHSLKVAHSTRLFRHGFEEKLIGDRMGNRSVKGIRAYQRLNYTQHLAASKALQSPTSSKEKRKRETPTEGPQSGSPPKKSKRIDQDDFGFLNLSNATLNNCTFVINPREK